MAIYWIIQFHLDLCDLLHRLYSHTEVAAKAIVHGSFGVYAQAAHNDSKQLVHANKHQQISYTHQLHQNNSTNFQYPITLVQD